MNVRRCFFLLLFLLCGWAGHAQYTEFGSWTGVKAKYEATKRLDFTTELETRTGETFNRYNQGFIQLGGSYRFNDYVKVAVDYRYAHRNQLADGIDLRQRVNTDLSLRFEHGEMQYDMRVRYQAARVNTEERGAAPDEALRLKAGFERKIMRKTRLDFSGELFWRDRGAQYDLSDWRLALKVSRKLGKGRSLTLGYLVQEQVNRRDPLLEHIAIVGFEFEVFRKKKKKEDPKP